MANGPKRVAIIGGGVGGLVTACYLANHGHSVVILEARESIGGKAAAIEEPGYTLDPGPSIIILTHLYRQAFESLGRRIDEYLEFERLPIFSRVLFGNQAFDLADSEHGGEKILKDYFPDDAQALTSLLDRLERAAPLVEKSIFRKPFEKPWNLADPNLLKLGVLFDPRLSYKQLVDSQLKSPLLRSFFYGFPSYGGQTYLSKAPGALLIPYYMMRHGVWYPKGGVAAIPRAFARLARELGVEIRTSAKVTGVRRQGGKVQSVELEGGETIAADAFISNADRFTFGAKFLAREVQGEPSLSYFTLHLGVRRELPEILHHTLVVPNKWEEGFQDLYLKQAFPQEPIVYLNNTSATDSKIAPPGRTNLFAVVTCPGMVASCDWGQASISEYRDRVYRVLSDAKISIERNDLDFERIQSPALFKERDGNFGGSLYGIEESKRLFGGILPLTNRDSEYKNLFYCGGSVQPGAGLPMVTLSGRFAASAANQYLENL